MTSDLLRIFVKQVYHFIIAVGVVKLEQLVVRSGYGLVGVGHRRSSMSKC